MEATHILVQFDRDMVVEVPDELGSFVEVIACMDFVA